jgi:hypothetical protein
LVIAIGTDREGEEEGEKEREREGKRERVQRGRVGERKGGERQREREREGREKERKCEFGGIFRARVNSFLSKAQWTKSYLPHLNAVSPLLKSGSFCGTVCIPVFN